MLTSYKRQSTGLAHQFIVVENFSFVLAETRISHSTSDVAKHSDAGTPLCTVYNPRLDRNLIKTKTLRQPFVTRCLDIVMFIVFQKNPGNHKDLDDLHVLPEGQVVYFGK